MIAQYAPIGRLLVHPALRRAVEENIVPGLALESDQVWKALDNILHEFSGENEALLRRRDEIQAAVDSFYLSRTQDKFDPVEYAAFLGRIGYVVPEGAPFKVSVNNVDPEISSIPGPQLVVPVDNARYALNAANARWGSLLDAFYGTNAGPAFSNGAEKTKAYNPVRGARVFKQAHGVLDQYFPLTTGAKYDDVVEFMIGNDKQLQCKLRNGKIAYLDKSEQFVGFNCTGSRLTHALLKHNSLHFILMIDRTGQAGKSHAAGLNDIVIESAVTAICDCEDSVAAVDAEDKAKVYGNWVGLMRGDLSESFSKGGKLMTRRLNSDKFFECPRTGKTIVLPGRVTLLVRNVGMHLLTDSVLFADTRREVPEGLVDAVITTLAAIHDLQKSGSESRNSRSGSIYVVKPKQHGPEEVDFHVRVFSRVEEYFGLPKNTVKLGIMDEERRTTVNLKECIRAAKERCIFINTGFLDRTGDEIHTCFRAGPVEPKADIKKAGWRLAYEKWNVDIGIETGLVGVAQIGKGMWAEPNNMSGMLSSKAAELRAGATTAWVPSPTAATLHALHYHEVDVKDVQSRLAVLGRRATLGEILQPPLLSKQLTGAVIQRELRESLQLILGYVSRWIQLGIGCSAVPDLNGVELMEDRATLRISSQLLGNWLHHGLISKEEIISTAKEMADVVDKQNQNQSGFRAMGPDYNDNGFKCAMHMIFNARDCPNGLTEGSLSDFRKAEKAYLKKSKM